jgi:hypothetical protein
MSHSDLMRSARKYAAIISTIVLFVIIISQLYTFIDQNRIVSGDDIRNYSHAYIKTYKNLAETYITLDNRTYLRFYRENPYFIKAFISTTHGGGLEFIPTKTPSFEFNFSNDKIEAIVFKGDDGLYPPTFSICEPHVLIQNVAFINRGFFIDIQENGSVLIREVLASNANINNTYLIKGSNRKKYWTEQVASRDASCYFRNDLIDAFAESEEFRIYLATPLLSKIANRILDRNGKGYYQKDRGYLLFKSDYKELYNIAKAYGLTSQFADGIYKFNKDQKESTPWWEQFDPTGILRGLLGAAIFAIISLIARRFYKSLQRTF